MLDLEPLEDREAQWVAHIEENLSRLLSQGKAFTPVDRIAEVFGDAFGEARSKHLRKALKQLHKTGATSTNPVGANDLGQLRVKPS